MLRVRNLEAGYGSLRVLKGLSLHVRPGEVVTIIGANGAGKTTLLGAVAGVVRAPAGTVQLNKQDVRGAPPERIVRLGCRLVPEGRHVFSTLTVHENLVLGAYGESRRLASGELDARLHEMFELFPILKERRRQLAGTLSGGQQQMLAIGRALMSRPKLLMMDEPSLGVAPLMVQHIYEAIADLKRRGMTILLVEQNARAALAVADRGYVMKTGQIVLDGTSDELRGNHEVQRAYLGKEYRRIDEEDNHEPAQHS
jgi:branched-chain amino acid transport system ATP-binding protein